MAESGFMRNTSYYFTYQLDESILKTLFSNKPLQFNSPTFDVDCNQMSEKWQLQIEKVEENGNRYLALYLIRGIDGGDANDVTAKFSLKLECNTQILKNDSSDTKCTFQAGSGWGWNQMISVEELKETVLDNGKTSRITVHCELIIEEGKEGDNCELWKKSGEGFCSKITSFHDEWNLKCFRSCIGESKEKTFSDIVVVESSDQQIFHAHRWILMQNEVLRTNLLSDIGKQSKSFESYQALMAERLTIGSSLMNSSPQEISSMIHQRDPFKIELPDIDSAVLNEFLRFLYLRKVENLHLVADDLLYVAEKYLDSHLKELCVDYLLKTVTPANACKLLLMANKFNAIRLKERCLEIIYFNKRQIMETSEFGEVYKNVGLIKEIIGADFSCSKGGKVVKWSGEVTGYCAKLTR